jgi:predicted MFS family arabinose efflux permease
MFRALSHRNYRLFWTGAFLSNVGTWMQAVAQGLLMYKLTSSAFWLGLDGFMATIPGLFLTLAGGVFADFVDRRRLLMITQFGAGLSALLLAVLVTTNLIDYRMILVLSFVTGCCMSLAGPSYQALTVELVPREELANAIALNSTQFQLSRVIGPSLAGVALEAFGLAGCFYANAASYIAVIVALALVRFDKKPGQESDHSKRTSNDFWNQLVQGLKYAWHRQRVFWLLMISAVTSFFGAPYITMLPVFARDVYHLDDSGLALLMGVAGAGAFCGALTLAYLGDFRRKGLTVLIAALAFSICLCLFSLSRSVHMAMIFLFGTGYSIVFSIALINTLLQQLVTDRMRGRVMSMFILSFIGTMPFGNLLAGSAATHFGAPDTIAAGGLIISIFIIITSIMNPRLREL